MRWLAGFSLLIPLAAGATISFAEPAVKGPDPKAAAFFESKIRPILTQQCQSCHSGAKPQGGLRVDTAESFFKGGPTGTLVNFARPEKSLLLQAVNYQGDVKMPPAGKLKPQALAELTAWVKMGAPWPGYQQAIVKNESGFTEEQRKFWAFQPVRSPAVPNVRNKAWVQSPIDAFILQKLEAKGLGPAPKADRRTLIRRVTFDLTGLPPTPKEVDDFLADRSPNAWAKVVDRLLASTAYGERWGRHWLDIARYADSNGLDENTAFGNAWRYRDYVIRSFNEDKPYDQFLREQVAGDLLPPSADPHANADRLIATGYLCLGPKVLAEPDKEKMVMDIVDEQIDTLGKSILGLTLGCARCHNHKFDPIPTADYYSLAGIFKSTRTMQSLATVARVLERPLNGDTSAAEKNKSEKAKVDAKEGEVRKLSADLQSAASATVIDQLPRYLLAARLTDRSADDLAREGGLDAQIVRRVSEYFHDRKNDAIWEPWLRLSVLPPAQFEPEAKRMVAEWQSNGRIKSWLPAVTGLFSGEAPKSLDEVAERYQGLFKRVNAAWIAQLRRAKMPKKLSSPDLEALRQVLYGPKSAFGLDDAQRLYPAADRERLAKLEKELDELKKAAPPVAMAIAVEDAKDIADCKIHIRGNTQTLGDVTPRRFPTILAGTDQNPLPKTSSGRLELAEWISSPKNPLTARVMVNRIWEHHFGEGIVRTPDNFGKLGERPTHPELLDWLADQFVKKSWSVKAMHRLILLSSAYQQSTAYNPKFALADPENRLLWHFNRQRLEVEAIRDSIFFVSGKLDRTMGGSLLGTKNFDYVTNDQSANAAQYDSPRRAIYLPVIRNAVYDVFQVFDFVEPSFTNGHRATTTVAPQALFLMNGKLVTEQAHVFAASLTGDDPARVREAYLKAYGRPATPAEVTAAAGYLKRYEEHLGTLETDAAKRHEKAWASFCQILFASNEFLYVN